MADTVSSPFTLRDIIKHVAPTLIALCLFIPFHPSLNNKIKSETLVFCAIILGYLLEHPVMFLADLVFKILSPVLQPFLKLLSMFFPNLPNQSTKKLAQKRDWLTKNWDYNKLFYSMTQEEREYIYLTGSYAEFYKLTSLYLIVYIILITSKFINYIYINYNNPDILNIVKVATNMSIPMIGGWETPFWSIFMLVFISFISSYINFINEYGVLFLENGQYVEFAKRYHREKGNIAKSIWGIAKKRDEPLSNIWLELYTKSENTDDESGFAFLGKTASDETGNFQFENMFSKCVGKEIRITLVNDGKNLDRIFFVNEKEIPFFETDFDPIIVKELPSSNNIYNSTNRNNTTNTVEKIPSKTNSN